MSDDGCEPPALVLPASIREEVVAEARAGEPREVCGVLGGEHGPRRSRVASAYPAENVATSPETRYLIDPETQLELFEELESRGEEIVGFYHSHPRGPSKPSATDVEAAAWPDRSYVIVSLGSGVRTETDVEVGSWRWREEGRFEREIVRLE